MSVTTIDVALFRKMVINGAINLKNNQKYVDELNVFPVPDGDTGTNMSMTVMSGIREVQACESTNLIDVAKIMSRGALMGARGNSGVILSQFFRGLYVGIKDLQAEEIDVLGLMSVLESGRKVAYKAVMEPVEGTILTVIREAAENTRANIEKFSNVEELLTFYVEQANISLQHTPELLPVLKEAGVVDSGGAGFLKIAEGMLMAVKGQILEVLDVKKEESKSSSEPEKSKYNYDVELTIELARPDNYEDMELKSALSLLGDHIHTERTPKAVAVKVSTNRPGRVLEICQKQGEFSSVNVGTSFAASVVEEAKAPKKHFALVTVCFGEGIVSTFKALGVDYVIEGGQTMNPSTEAFVEAIKAVNAENVIIIPNNGNVIMAAKQAVSMVEGTKVEVLKAKTIAQGYASLMYFDPEADMETNFASMSEACSNVKSGELTYSIRDTEIKGVKIKSGDFMGIVNDEIKVSTEAKVDALKGLLENCINEESQMVTFFCGKDVTKEEMADLEGLCSAVNPNVEVEIIEGKQDIYSYIVAVE